MKDKSSVLNGNTWKRRTVILLFCLILAVAVCIRILSFCGFYGSDDGVYSELAFKMATGTFKISDYSSDPVFPLRTGLIAPVALGFKIAGPNEWALVTYPFVLSLAGIFLMFFAARAFFNTSTGLIGASLLAFIPLDVRSASLLLPDLPAAFWAALGVLFLYSGTKRETLTSKIGLGLLSGFSFGLSWLCKESVLFLFPFLLIYAIWILRHRKGNFILFVTAGLTVLVFFMVESWIYHQQTFDFFYRFHSIEINYNLNKEWFFSEGSRFGWAQGEYISALIKRIFWKGPFILFLNPTFGFVTGAALISAIYAVVKKKRAFLIPGIWFLSLAIMLNFSSSSLSFYRPLVLFDRYVYLLIFPAVLLTAGLLYDLLSKQKPRESKISTKLLFGGLLAIGLFVGCFLGIYRTIDRGIGSPVERQVSHIISPQDRILTDTRTARVLNFFWKYPQTVLTKDFEGMKTEDVPGGVFVLINRNRLNFLKTAYNYVFPEFIENRPEHWLLKWSTDGAELHWVR
ncbi:ArnT family glycosyltransferase [Acidobacteriota bacterium]